MSLTHPMYVCDRCNFSHFHPLNYCPKCPGLMHRRRVSMPESPCKTTDEFDEFIRAQGLDYIGEFPAIEPAVRNAAKLTRMQEKLDAAKRDNIPKLVESWERIIELERNKNVAPGDTTGTT